MAVDAGTPRERTLLRKAKELRAQRDAAWAAAEEAQARLDFLSDLRARAAYEGTKIDRREKRSGLREGVAVALLSDVHDGEIVDSEKVHGLNSYDMETCEARVHRFFQGMAWLVAEHQRSFHIRDVVLGVLGDVITGYLRDEDLEMCEVSPVYASIHARALLKDGIDYFLERLEIERLHLLFVHGNHGRTTDKPRIKSSAENSFEHLMFLHLADDYREEPRVQAVVCQGTELLFGIYDWRTRWMHGDEVRYNAGIGGVTVPLNRALFRLNKALPCIVTNLGHHHTYQSLGDAVINGSVVGYSEFAQKRTYPYEPPRQAFYILDSRRGMCMSTPIWVDSKDESWRG